MTTPNTRAHRWLHDSVRQVRADLYLCQALTGWLFGLGAVLALVMALFLLDNALGLPVAVRSILTPVAAVLTLAILAAGLVRPLLARPSPDQAAIAIQRRFPELDARVINALQVSQAAKPSPFASAIVEETAEKLYPLDLAHVANWRRPALAAGFLLTMLCGLAIYHGLYRPYLLNAAARYLHPTRGVPAAGSADIRVDPGDAVLTLGDTLEVRAAVAGHAASAADLLWRAGGDEWQSRSMSPDGPSFLQRFANVRDSFEYRVRAADSSSPTYRVTVYPALGISRFDLRYEFPAYTRLPAESVADSDGRIEAVAGTQVSLEARVPRPIKSAHWVLENADPTPARVLDGVKIQAAFTLQESGRYSIRLVAENGQENPEAPSYPIVARPDTPPAVELRIEPPREKATPAESLALRILARDDFGVGSVTLEIRRGKDSEANRKAWRLESPRDSVEIAELLDLSALDLAPGDTLRLRAHATDLNDLTGPGTGFSEDLVLEVVEPGKLADNQADLFSDGLEGLSRLVKRQGENLDRTTDLRAQLAEERAAPDSGVADLAFAHEEQVGIRQAALALSKALGALHPSAPATLDPLAAGEMVEAVRTLETAVQAAREEKLAPLENALTLEDSIRDRLQQLLDHLVREQSALTLQEVIRALQEIRDEQAGIHDLTSGGRESFESLAAREGVLRPKMSAAEALLDRAGASLSAVSPDLSKAVTQIARDARGRHIPAEIAQAQTFLQELRREPAQASEEHVLKKLEATLESLLQALAAQAQSEEKKWANRLEDAGKKARQLAGLEKQAQKAVETLHRLDKDQLGAPERQKLAQLAEFQERASQAAAAAAEDLKKLPPSSFTGDMVKDFESVSSQLKLAEKALEEEATEKCMECTREVMEKLMKIEKESKDGQAFLDDKPDHTRFNLQDIPEGQRPEMPMVDLPDKLTDLVGELIDKQQEQNDQTDDKSSNWSKADSKAGKPLEGPVSSFGGKGKTGNHLPDPTEVSGRGGSGRTGQTSGELIEGATKDLDGASVPERRTPDPVQDGEQAIDDRSSQQAKATGGGKEGGAGGEGLPGRPDDVFARDLEEMAERQDSLRSSAEQLESTLSSLHLPTWTLPEAIRCMKASQEDLRACNLVEAQEKQKIALQSLKAAYEGMKGRPYVQAEKVSSLPPDLKREIIQAEGEQFPAAFQDMLERYYKGIAGGNR
ncbi:MAG: hypothetical protein HYU36_22735 [Planctomycetes bacterium]|nr:hypothetical protein [Planctomycetota bacterium]